MGEIEFWDDSEIEGATDWHAEIESKLASANAAVLLVSNHFLDSAFITSVEPPKILSRHDMQVFWLHLTRSRVEEQQPEIVRFESLSEDPNITLSDLLQRSKDDLSAELLRITRKLTQALRN